MLQYLDETNTNLNTKKYIIFHKRAFLVNYGEIGGLWLLILSVRPWMHTYMRGRTTFVWRSWYVGQEADVTNK